MSEILDVKVPEFSRSPAPFQVESHRGTITMGTFDPEDKATIHPEALVEVVFQLLRKAEINFNNEAVFKLRKLLELPGSWKE